MIRGTKSRHVNPFARSNAIENKLRIEKNLVNGVVFFDKMSFFRNLERFFLWLEMQIDRRWYVTERNFESKI